MLTRWDPFGEMERLTSRFFGSGEEGFVGRRNMQPWVDVYETDATIELRAELPGMKRGDVRVDISDNVLTISGERKLEHEEERDNYRRIERSYGQFSRSFTLPRTVDAENAKAELREGVLCVILQKREQPKTKQIAVAGEERGVTESRETVPRVHA